MRRTPAVLCLATVLACSGACTGALPTAGSSTSGSSTTGSSTTGTSTGAAPPAAQAASLDVAAGDCPDATGHAYVSSGAIALGPFMDESNDPQAAAFRKLWVASQRPGPDTMTLRVTAPDGVGTATTHGPSGAQVDNAEQFWPGEIPVSASGTYRLEATVGPDHICVTVRYQR